MWSFNTFKDIRYWMLLVPFLIILVLYIHFTPSYILEKPYVSALSLFIFPTLFWSTYHLWKHFGDKKERNDVESSSGL
ncbi:permease [Solibacillus sp. FSL W7-1464]|uniref:permease n=1 Tax=Solibacillus sp. FSL W7-1464 TaxID=2921706 RepID=UPI0030F4EF70